MMSTSLLPAYFAVKNTLNLSYLTGYYSILEQDKVFGASYDAYSTR